MSDMKGTPCISGGYTNTMTDEDSDLIRRSEAITAIQKAYADTEGGEDKCAVWKNVGLTNALNIMQDLPSAQPKRTEKRTETRACDCISRQAVTDTVRTIILGFFSDEDGAMNDTEKTLLSVSKSICDGVRALPSAQPEIIRCRKCKFASGDSRICMKFGHSPIGELDFCAWAERRTDDGE